MNKATGTLQVAGTIINFSLDSSSTFVVNKLQKQKLEWDAQCCILPVPPTGMCPSTTPHFWSFIVPKKGKIWTLSHELKEGKKKITEEGSKVMEGIWETHEEPNRIKKELIFQHLPWIQLLLSFQIFIMQILHTSIRYHSHTGENYSVVIYPHCCSNI